MKLTRISITEEKLGEFYVDEYMKVTYFHSLKVLVFGKLMYLN
ncbi:hypothetical protein G2469_00069 [Escherichia phage vB_EcoM_G2469]|uniref:Uncharacterized protein n=1 Tax=Escherichia phage vB_EcoM_G2469 TaxID=2502415 RepID=A0A482GE16_9CAUD|nr:hypothetical protein G2469_00069 [Escherichia phage vB_EcoM_G2469]